jgi:Protein of unknown function (DUF742)
MVVTGPGEERWLDRDAGPVVRPYALTRGRTQSAGAQLGLTDLVEAEKARAGETRGLPPEHRRLLALCARPAAVADLASDVDLPLGVVRVLIGDLCQQGVVRVVRRTEQGTASDASVLRSVLDGLRAL